MTAPLQNNQAQTQENKPTDKELNFRALEAKLAQERQARLEMEKEIQRLAAEKNQPRQTSHDDDDDKDDEPYVDHRKLNKKLAKFNEQNKQQTQAEIQRAIQQARQEASQEAYVESNPDFYDVLQNHADKLAQKSPQLAKAILAMPDNFDRQKLVYQNIKELGLHQEPKKQQSIQEKVDANKRSPYYQPSGIGAAPYSQVGDYTEQGQKQAYEKMQALKKQLRI
jgi:hypothetical protein